MAHATPTTSAAWDSTLSFVSQELGVTRGFLTDNVVPSWICAPVGDDTEGFEDAVRNLASALKVPEQRLLAQQSPLITDVSAARCKGAHPEKLDKQKPARLMAEVLGRHLVSILDEGAKPIMRSAGELRSQLLESSDLINLKALLKLCWSLDLPVAHLGQAPTHAPHAMAVNIDGRCAVVLIRNKRHQGWHLFDLAHELGHVMLGHVKPGEAIVDGEGMILDADEEVAANEFAFELLTGSPMSVSSKHIMDGASLQRQCVRAAPVYRVDPQWLIVSVGFNWPAKYWGVCGKALALGWPDDNAPKLIEEVLLAELKVREVSRTRQSLITTFALRNQRVK